MNFCTFDKTGAARFKTPEVEKLHIFPFCIRRNRQAGHLPDCALYFHGTYVYFRVPAHPWGYFVAVSPPPALLVLRREGSGRGGCRMPAETTSGELAALHDREKGQECDTTMNFIHSQSSQWGRITGNATPSLKCQELNICCSSSNGIFCHSSTKTRTRAS